MKTFKTATILALILMTATQAVASTCDLSVAPQIIERQNPVVIETFKGKRDWIGRHAGQILLIGLGAMIPIPMGIVALSMQQNGDSRFDSTKSAAWYQRQYEQLSIRCNNYIRENFADDILVDTGGEVIAAHYYCSEPYQYQVTSRRIRPAINLMNGDPVYSEFSSEQMMAQKCQKLQLCIARSNNVTELEQLQQMQIQLGCQ